jgi:protease-4
MIQLTPDQIIDRMKLKKQMTNWRFLAIIALLMMFVATFSNNTRHQSNPASVIGLDYIARIKIENVILNDQDRLDILSEIAEDKSIKAVVLHINSPGGTVVGGEALYNAIRKISAQKPIVTVMGDLAASAGYMTAIASDYLIAHQGTITGSIGVLAQGFEFTELAKKVGVEFYSFKSSPLKGGPMPTEKLSDTMKESMDETIMDMYDMFYSMVMERRKFDHNHMKLVADGRAYTGRQALKLGLIDAIGDEDLAIDWLENAKKVDSNLKVRDVLLYYPQDTWSKFMGQLNIMTENAKLLNIKGLVSFL